MIDLIDVAKDFLVYRGFDAYVKRLDQFTGREGIVVRRVPSRVTSRYFDGGEALSYIYQVIVRRRSGREAMETCCEIADLLKHAWLASRNGSYSFHGQEVYTGPQELELDEANFSAWEVRFEASISR